MSETYKEAEGKLEITTVSEEVINKDLTELENELAQAENSLVQVKKAHAEREANIQETIDLFQKRYDEAVELGIKAVEEE